MVVQLWHCGRVSHTSFQKDGRAPVGPSAIRARTKTFVANEGFVDASAPRALDLDEIPGVVDDFRYASTRAIEAGFDGVELHGAHGYLLDAFLRDGTNHRTDAYGGSIENRARLLLEVVEACADAIGAGRLGVRISPVSTAGDSRDSNPQALFNHVVKGLNPFGLAYVHVVEGETGGPRYTITFDYPALHGCFDGVWMVNNGYDRKMGDRGGPRAAAPIWCRSGACSSPIRIWSSACGRTPRSTRRWVRRRSSAAALTAIPTIPASNKAAPGRTPANWRRPDGPSGGLASNPTGPPAP